MPWCSAEEECKQPDQWVKLGGEDSSCTFEGYGWFAIFHPECCPRTCAGEPCLGRHYEEATEGEE